MIDRPWPCGSEFIAAPFGMVEQIKCAEIGTIGHLRSRVDFHTVSFAIIASKVVILLANTDVPRMKLSSATLPRLYTNVAYAYDTNCPDQVDSV